MYFPITTKTNAKMATTTTVMSPKGTDNRNLPQMLDTDYAQNIVNYWVTGTGQLQKRKGLQKLFDSLGADAILMAEKWTSTKYVYAYGTTVAVWDTSTQTSTIVKSDFTGTTFEGRKYGDYFFVTNKTDGLWVIDPALAIVDYTSTYGAPLANQIEIFGSRILLGDLSTDDTAIFYSGTDDGNNPPFANASYWTEGTLQTQAGSVYYRNGGTINSITSLGQTIIGFGDTGKFGFQITTENIGGVYYKNDDPTFYRQDFGGGRGAISTPVGVIYVNKKGVWQLSSVGQDNVKFSDQEENITYLLGDTYFEDVDVSNATIIHDERRGYVYISVAKNSGTNNLVIAINMQLKGYPISKFTGMNVSRFFSDGDDIYAGSALKSILYSAFTGSDDDGAAIGTDYKQELNVGSLQTRKMLKGLYVQGFLSASSVINIRFDIYDKDGVPTEDKLKFQWEAQYNLNGSDGWDSASWDTSSWDGDSDLANLIESFDGMNATIRDFQRIIVHVTCSDKYPHVLNWLSLETYEKTTIRRRKLTQIS